MEQKLKSLSQNVFLFTIGSLGQKALAFFLVPLYTSVLSPGQYGQIDLVNIGVTLLVPLFTANIAEAVMRFTLQDRDNRTFFSTGAAVMLRGSGILAAALLLAGLAGVGKGMLLWTFALYLLSSVTGLYHSYARAAGRLRTYVLGSLVQTAVSLAANVALLVWLRRGVEGYFLAQVLGAMAGAGFLEARLGLRNSIRWNLPPGGEILRQMLGYSVPTIFTALAWWINSSLDHYFVSALCGIAANGIYAVAYKIPNLLGIFQGVFQQAWTLSAIAEFDREDKDGFFGKTYTGYQGVMLLLCSGLILANRALSRLLYAGDFFEAWRYVPVLLAAGFFSALSGYLGSIFSAVKDTRTCAWSTMASAGVNTLLNLFWIPRYGIAGAAWATLAAYVVSWAIRAAVSRRYIRMRCSFARDVGAYCVLLAQVWAALAGRYDLEILALGILMLLYGRGAFRAVRTGKHGKKGPQKGQML